jgi:outer membrane immunogenic protein
LEDDMRVLLGTVAALVIGASSAMAADLPVKARPMPVEVYGWTGFYIGGNVGYSWGRSRSDATFTSGGTVITPPAGSVTQSNFNLNGGVAGGQAGYNWQTGSWVWGFETDLQWSRERGSGAFLCSFTAGGGPCLPTATFLPTGAGAGTAVAMDQSIEWFGTLRARAGLLFSPTVLGYVTGGFAYGGVRTDLAISSVTLTQPGVPVSATSSSKTTHAGWTIGAGVEALFARDWSAKLEYLYVDLGTFDSTVALVTPAIAASVHSRVTDNVFRFGVNYHFPAGPVVARY